MVSYRAAKGNRKAQNEGNSSRMTAAEKAAALRIEPTLPGAQDIEAMNNRVKRLELLYEAARRDDPNSGAHSLYTGLHASAPF